MSVTVRSLDDCVLLTVTGAMDASSSGRLYDAFVGCCAGRGRRIVVDLSGVPLATRAGVRGLIVAAKCVACAGGALRICRASSEVEEQLASFGFHHLLRCDPTLDAARAAVGSRTAARLPRAAAPGPADRAAA